MPRRLSLRSERVAALTTSELEAVVAGLPLPTQPCTGVYVTWPSITLQCFTGTTGTT